MPLFPAPAYPSLEAVDALSTRLGPKIDIEPTFIANAVRLPMGKTTYWLFGPEDGPKVVLIHGLTIPSLIWKNIAPYLAENKFRVLVYDLFGRGYSEAPDTTYTTELFITQLALLLQHTQFAHAHVIGLSMGGAITAAFAATFPNLVTEKIVFIASAGLMELPASVTSAPSSQSLAATGSVFANPQNIMGQMRQLQTDCLPGYENAVASSVGDGPLCDLDYAFKTIAGNTGIKSFIIHGTDDSGVDPRFGEKIKTLLPTAEMLRVEGADHDLIVADEYYEQVRTAILRFLQG